MTYIEQKKLHCHDQSSITKENIQTYIHTYIHTYSTVHTHIHTCLNYTRGYGYGMDNLHIKARGNRVYDGLLVLEKRIFITIGFYVIYSNLFTSFIYAFFLFFLNSRHNNILTSQRPSSHDLKNDGSCFHILSMQFSLFATGLINSYCFFLIHTSIIIIWP